MRELVWQGVAAILGDKTGKQVCIDIFRFENGFKADIVTLNKDGSFAGIWWPWYEQKCATVEDVLDLVGWVKE